VKVADEKGRTAVRIACRELNGRCVELFESDIAGNKDEVTACKYS
jgi:hypothetical protein